jgi:stage V sporulation protein S
MDFLKVSSKSSPSSVAGAIAGMIKDGVPVEIQSVGAGAVNQAVKAIAISKGFLSPVGIEIVCVPSFADIIIDGENRTAIRFSVMPREVVQQTIPLITSQKNGVSEGLSDISISL